jgi:hypothetical protein
MSKMRKPVRCQCGFLIRYPEGAHERSIFHRQHRHIKKIIANRAMSYAALAASLGITRQAVHRFAALLGYVPRESTREPRLARQARLWREQKLVRKVLKKCEDLGFTAAPSVRRSDPRFLESNTVVINGRRARVLQIYRMGANYLRLRRIKRQADFYIGISVIGFFVFPAEVWETFPAMTTFSFQSPRSAKPGADSFRHDYRDYLEAWDLLKAKDSYLPGQATFVR